MILQTNGYFPYGPSGMETYGFGTHSIHVIDQEQEVDVLNAKINELHTQAGKDAEALQEAVRKVTELNP